MRSLGLQRRVERGKELSKKLAAAKKSSKKGSDSKSNNDGPLSGEEEARIVGQQGGSPDYRSSSSRSPRGRLLV